MRVVSATGSLAVFGEAGVLAAADVHVARRLGELAREPDEGVLLATALAVRAVRLGSTCLELDRLRDVTVDEEQDPADLEALPWPEPDDVAEGLRRSPLVVGGQRGGLRPLRLVDTSEGPLLYLDRYWRQEQTVRHLLADRALTPPPVDVPRVRAGLDRLFGTASAPDRQRIAVAMAATRWTTVLAGGPGTGKTTTVARVLALLHGPEVRIALAAPTGKAAARLQESVREQASGLGLPADLTAVTLHRLLGWRPDSRTRFRHDRHDRLPYDVVVVDETSMVSLTMMARLLEAMRPDARLLLVGDPDQLTSVDAGAVLADLVARPVTGAVDPVLAELVGPDLTAADDPEEARLSDGEHDRLRNGIVRLSRGRRFGGSIARLAVAVREGHADRALELLRDDGSPEVSFVEDGDVAAVRADVVAAATAVTAAARAGDVGAALSRLEDHRLLCAHRHGLHGVALWDRRALAWAAAALDEPLDPAVYYPGQPLLVTRNDHDAKVYNGDTGVVVDRGGGDLVAAFGRGSTPVLLHPSRLADVQTVYAMTIHRSQGSQYDTVSVVLPPTASSLLTRELLYTAITRARRHVRVLGTEESVRAAVGRQVLRASGLRRVVDV
ncbi:MAG: Exodeoxyribonuclease V alpha chain [uncultured Frankineae bacterium]|uniref:RecBCD enzyme subunit RecD n=1 Tax=uncultured Frankineae bacterium TaxID=437475 RepID=A0A6J4KZQ7_9ACTN|nr:MAG: Exodeoxyribonuclease V alpha chain [uncultured Frankineae bacterium]